MYRQIAEDLRLKIESGELAAGSQLPTELELRDQYQASRNTVRDAIRWLTTRGLVDAHAGQGTFVSRQVEPFVTTLSGREANHTASMDRDLMSAPSEPRVEIQRAPRYLADMLRLREDAEIISRQHDRHIDGIAWSLQTSFYPMDLVRQGAARLLAADGIPQGVAAYLEEVLGIKEVGSQARILVGPPSKDEAELFRLADDGRVSVIKVLRTSWAADGKGAFPFGVTITAYPADRNQLLINWGEVPDPS
jgi:GntR family transcriptional regulator